MGGGHPASIHLLSRLQNWHRCVYDHLCVRVTLGVLLRGRDF